MGQNKYSFHRILWPPVWKSITMISFLQEKKGSLSEFKAKYSIHIDHDHANEL